VLFCLEFNFVIALLVFKTGAGANLLNGDSRSNDKGKDFYYQKIMGSYVSEGVQAIRCELVSSSC